MAEVLVDCGRERFGAVLRLTDLEHPSSAEIETAQREVGWCEEMYGTKCPPGCELKKIAEKAEGSAADSTSQ